MGWNGYGPNVFPPESEVTDKNALVAPAMNQQNQFSDTLANLQTQNNSMFAAINAMQQPQGSTGVNSGYNAGTPLNPNTLPNIGRAAGGARMQFGAPSPSGKNPSIGPFG